MSTPTPITNPSSSPPLPPRPRTLILTDISNEPDDAESLVRYLLYANELDTRGIVAVTSTWMKDAVHPEDVERIVRAYGEVVERLDRHVEYRGERYPSGEEVLGMVRTGPVMYGKKALNRSVPLSSGAQLLIDRVDESPHPLWILAWGGVNTLAQALQHIHRSQGPNSRSAESCKLFRSKLRVYTISDQDDTGPWIRRRFPDIFYIASQHGWNQYGLAAWTGISGERFYGFDVGGPPDFEQWWGRDWVKRNIQIGDYGKEYPDYMFIPEGDTPTFLYLIRNGLGDPEHPNWGSWGGRYALTQDSSFFVSSTTSSSSGEIDNDDDVETNIRSNHYSDCADRVFNPLTRTTYRSSQSTIWRWRPAFQSDFATRMHWTLPSSTFPRSNHSPVPIINSSPPFSPSPLHLTALPSSTLTLDASSTYDPDGPSDALTFSWLHYKDVTASQWWIDAEVADVTFVDISAAQNNSVVSVRMPPADKCAVDLISRRPVAVGQELHFLLDVRDSGGGMRRGKKKKSEDEEGDVDDCFKLTAYKRVIVQIINPDFEGGGEAGEGKGSVGEGGFVFEG